RQRAATRRSAGEASAAALSGHGTPPSTGTVPGAANRTSSSSPHAAQARPLHAVTGHLADPAQAVVEPAGPAQLPDPQQPLVPRPHEGVVREVVPLVRLDELLAPRALGPPRGGARHLGGVPLAGQAVVGRVGTGALGHREWAAR